MIDEICALQSSGNWESVSLLPVFSRLLLVGVYLGRFGLGLAKPNTQSI